MGCLYILLLLPLLRWLSPAIRHTGPEQPQSLGRAGGVCTLLIFLTALLLSHPQSSPRPAPPGLFVSPSRLWVSLGSGENYQVKCCCLTSPWDGLHPSISSGPGCLPPRRACRPLQPAPDCPSHPDRVPIPGGSAASHGSGTAVQPSRDFLFPGWYLQPQLVSAG